MPHFRPAGRLTVLLAAAAVAIALLEVGGGDPVGAAPRPDRPPANIVYVVVDDLSSNILPYMSEVGALAHAGVSFDRFFVTDSMCCPSRASTLTGLYPHNSKVRTNTWPDGGFGTFQKRHLDSSMGPILSAAGYRTGFVGKFLNGYNPEGSHAGRDNDAPAYGPGLVPPGWDEWHVAGGGYGQFDYVLASAVDQPVANLERYGHAPQDYLTDVISDKTTAFLDRAAAPDAAPFFLTVAPFAVHSQIGPGRKTGDSVFPPAPRDRKATPGEDVPRSWPDPDYVDGDCGPIRGGCPAVPFPEPAEAAGFNQLPTSGHRWMPNQPLDAADLRDSRELYLDRIRMAQSVDDLVGQIRADLDRLELSDETYLVFTSDNGYHLGEHGLQRGKNSAFDHDIRVPMIVVPPGGTSAATVPAIAQNTDLLPTFLDIAGQRGPRRHTDGASLLPYITSAEAPIRGWRQGALVEFAENKDRVDPDREAGRSPPSYRALRTADYLYVDYAAKRQAPRDRDAELYDLVRDPSATVNVYRELSAAEKRALDLALDRYASCSGSACTSAARRLPAISAGRG